MNILVLNPGGNSLKAEIVACGKDQRFAFEGKQIISLGIDDIGNDPKLSHYKGKKIVKTEPISAASYEEAADSLCRFLAGDGSRPSGLEGVDAIGIRVVHGGPDLVQPTLIDAEVEQKIIDLEKLAPLHNKSSIEVLGPVRHWLVKVPAYGVFDTAFHRTIPEHAALYALPFDLSQKHQIRRYGFHGISHRYLLERYAHLADKPVSECSIVTMHLESGCSVSAIRAGRSIDNTMGFTPLEGLMMGTRSGDLDASILPFLVREEGLELDDVMTILNKRSGLLGVSGESLDTRVLMKSYEANPRVKLAIEMFAYRLMKAVAAMLSAVGEPEAVIFGGGIAENNSLVRSRVAEGLRSFGFEVSATANQELIDVEGRLTTSRSRVQGWVIPVEEGMQIAHECSAASVAPEA